MTNLTESSVFEDGIYQLETDDPVLGGPPAFDAGSPITGHANAQAQQITNRTKWLYDNKANTSDLVNTSDPAKGAGMVGFKQVGTGAVPRTAYDKLREFVSVKDFGAVGDGIADDTVAIQAAANYCASFTSYDVGRGGPTLLFPETGGQGYRVSSGISVSAGVPVEMVNCSLIYGEAANITVLKLGQESTRTFRCKYKGIDVRRDNNITRASEDDIGVRIVNSFFSEIEIRGVRGFCVGFQLNGVNPGEGCYYNKVSLGYFFGNKFNIDLKGGDGVNAGWVNENLFLNGECQGGTVDSYDRYGVRVWNTPAGSILNDNNVFLKPSFEMNGALGNESIPFLILHSHALRVINVRQEGANSTVLARIENDSKNTDIHVGHQQVSESNIVDLSNDKSTTLHCQKTNWSYHGRMIFNSGTLGKLACKYNSTRYHIPGLNFYRQVDTTLINNSGPLTIEGNKVIVSATDAISRMVDTNRCKKFVVNIDADIGEYPWVVVQCFDSSGTILTSAGLGHPYLSGPGFLWSTAWNGYALPSSVAAERLLTVTEDVKTIRLGIYSGKLRGFSLHALGVNNQFSATYSGYEDVVQGANIATSAPTDGTWIRGRVVYNAEPTIGANVGWECISSGTPGTWVPFGYSNITGSIVYDPASLIDGDGITTTVTATGAALGDFSTASFSSDLQGATLTSWVSSANTVSVRFQNETGAPIDLVSGTLRIRVIKQ